jgi:hypothetical protein
MMIEQTKWFRSIGLKTGSIRISQRLRISIERKSLIELKPLQKEIAWMALGTKMS